MIKILFVCHGNICRSPMAEFVFRAMAQKTGLAQACEVQSAALSAEELGNPVYPPARAMLARHGISCEGKHARQICEADVHAFDLLIGMEQRHVDAMRRRFGTEAQGKARCLLDYTNMPGDIADPWYTRDFETAYTQIEAGCRALLAQLAQAAQ